MVSQDLSAGALQEGPGIRDGQTGQKANAQPERPASRTLFPGGTVESSPPSDYAELRRIVREQGLLEKQPLYYIGKFLLVLALLAGGLTFLVLVDNLWLRLVDAAFLAFVSGQLGLLGHSAGHYQMFRSRWKDDLMGLFVTVLVGVSRTWWIDKHNRHHTNPNQLDMDPDTFIPVVAFTEEQALGRSGFYGMVVRYQSYLYVPLMCLQALGIRLASIQFLWRERPRFFVTESVLLVLSLAAYVGMLFYLMSPLHATLVLVIHQALFGLYLSSVFAPNHKGMLIIDKDSGLDFLRRQVLTSRNVTPNRLTDFWYGGLNYQIEHHLFPNMPHNRLREAQRLVKGFCRDRSVSYHETSMFRSQREILSHLHRVSAPLRQRKS